MQHIYREEGFLYFSYKGVWARIEKTPDGWRPWREVPGWKGHFCMIIKPFPTFAQAVQSAKNCIDEWLIFNPIDEFLKDMRNAGTISRDEYWKLHGSASIVTYNRYPANLSRW